jgi:Bacterial RNA polymerase, alpha chain C terminal domain
MKQVGARHDIIREWRSLPNEQRQTDEQAEAFAMQIKDKYKFSNDSADPYQTVKGWLLSYLSLARGRGVNAKDKGEMPDDEKSTDPGLSAADRKALRVREAQEAIADHEEARPAFHENRERLRKERRVREATEGPMLAPTPELPDDTPIERVLFSNRIQNVLRAADLKTVGEVREISDKTLISLPDFGRGSLSDLRKKLGLP